MRRAHLSVLALAAMATAAQAHHSLAGYNQGQQLPLEGSVKEFSFSQPHPYIILDVAKQPWRLEMDNLSELKDVGLTRDSFKPGDKVLVAGNPMRYGRNAMYLRRLDRPSDGLHYEQLGMSPSVSFRKP